MSRPSRRELGSIFRRAMHDLGDDIEAALEATVDTAIAMNAGGDLSMQIANETARYYGLTLPQLKTHSRVYSVSRPRSVAWWLIRHYDKSASWPGMGRGLGGFDHSTVIHAARLVERTPELRADAMAIAEKIGLTFAAATTSAENPR
jgi:chromosomal replication initiation ATPase DnaA